MNQNTYVSTVITDAMQCAREKAIKECLAIFSKYADDRYSADTQVELQNILSEVKTLLEVDR